MAINSPITQRWFIQTQTAPLAFNNSSGTWTNTGAQMVRVDRGSASMTRNAPYMRFPVLTGTRSEVTGVRGRKIAGWQIRGLPIIPSGAAGTVPDIDILLKNAFGQAATIVTSTSATYSFADPTPSAFSILTWPHGSTSLTARAAWGCYVSRITFRFNENYIVGDFDGFCGYIIDNPGFSGLDSQAKAGLSTYPLEPSSPTVNGSPIAGFGTGYTCVLDSQDVSLKVAAISLTYETGLVPKADVFGSPYIIAALGDFRRVSLQLGNVLDDDSSALNDLKLKCDTDNVTINAVITAGTVAGSIMTTSINNIQPNSFNLRDNGPEVAFELPTSYAHASNVGSVDDMTLAFT